MNTVQYINIEAESNDEDNSTDEESIRSTSAISQPEGPTEYQVRNSLASDINCHIFSHVCTAN